MGIIVDTNVFLDTENARRELSPLLSSDEQYYLAAITASELLTGVALAKDPAQRVHRLTWSESIIDTIPCLAFDLEVARTYAEMYAYQLQISSRSAISVHDLQIAATAITHNFAVLSSNNKDFRHIPGLKLLSP